MAAVMGSQTINGQNYTMYSPAWYDAMRQDKIRTAQTAGAAAGQGEKSFFDNLSGSPALASLFGLGGSSSSSGGGQPITLAPTSGGTVSAPAVPSVAPVDTTAARSAAFASAKDEAAQTAAASLRALQGTLAARGMGGAGYEAGQVGQTLAREANTIGEAGRSEAEGEAGLREREAALNYSGKLTQRGQDITSGNEAAQRGLEGGIANLNAGTTQRGQDIQRQIAMMSSLRSLFGGSYGGSALAY